MERLISDNTGACLIIVLFRYSFGGHWIFGFVLHFVWTQLEFTNGDDRLRQRDYCRDVLLFGIAPVPVTHMVHAIDAKSKLVAYAEGVAAGLSMRLAPQYA